MQQIVAFNYSMWRKKPNNGRTSAAVSFLGAHLSVIGESSSTQIWLFPSPQNFVIWVTEW